MQPLAAAAREVGAMRTTAYPRRDGTAVRRKDSAVKVVPQPWPAFASPHLLEASFRRGARSDRRSREPRCAANGDRRAA